MEATYTIDSYSYKKYWFGVSSMIGPVNFYVLGTIFWSIRMSQKPIVHPFNWELNVILRIRKNSGLFSWVLFRSKIL
jgi:hypothetical protein